MLGSCIKELYIIYSNTGIQFEMGDPRVKEFQELLDELVATINRVAILDFLPWMNKFLPASLVTWICRLDALDNFKEKMCIYFQVSKCSNGLLHSKWIQIQYGWQICAHFMGIHCMGINKLIGKISYGQNPSVTLNFLST